MMLSRWSGGSALICSGVSCKTCSSSAWKVEQVSIDSDSSRLKQEKKTYPLFVRQVRYRRGFRHWRATHRRRRTSIAHRRMHARKAAGALRWRRSLLVPYWPGWWRWLMCLCLLGHLACQRSRGGKDALQDVRVHDIHHEHGLKQCICQLWMPVEQGFRLVWRHRYEALLID